jgi:Cystine-knot domain
MSGKNRTKLFARVPVCANDSYLCHQCETYPCPSFFKSGNLQKAVRSKARLGFATIEFRFRQRSHVADVAAYCGAALRAAFGFGLQIKGTKSGAKRRTPKHADSLGGRPRRPTSNDVSASSVSLTLRNCGPRIAAPAPARSDACLVTRRCKQRMPADLAIQVACLVKRREGQLAQKEKPTCVSRSRRFNFPVALRCQCNQCDQLHGLLAAGVAVAYATCDPRP